MIKLKYLKWSNWFSYGSDNKIDLSCYPVTQIVGANGSGKTSIFTVLEETLTAKNNRNIKKQDIPNRMLKETLTSSLTFSIYDDEYSLDLERKNTIKIKLTKNGKDISSHTSTKTYNELENLFGISFKTLISLIFQNSKTALPFLYATDTQRKLFLIDLFNLNKYIKIQEILKKEVRDIELELAKANAVINSVSELIKNVEKNSKKIEKELKEVPKVDSSLYDEIKKLKEILDNIKETNNRINTNNEYKRQLVKINKDILCNILPPINKEELKELSRKLIIIKNKLKEAYSKKDKYIKLTKADICSNCTQSIPVELFTKIIVDTEKTILELDSERKELSKKLDKLKKEETEYLLYKTTVEEFEKLQNYIDKDLETEVYQETDILAKIANIKQILAIQNNKIRQINDYNTEAGIHNIEVQTAKKILNENNEQLNTYLNKYDNIEKELEPVKILKSVFSTNGIISYKLEYLAKSLEDTINSHLSELSNNKFIFEFRLEEDKLNIKILNEGNVTTLDSLSEGEKARVNLATLLAIRSMMMTISNTKINFLFLDEIFGVLDKEGKEKAIELLQNQKDLNTFIVSHEYWNPLVSRIQVNKDSIGISKLSMEE